MSRLKHSDGSCSKSFWDSPLVEGPGNCAIANCTIFSGRTTIYSLLDNLHQSHGNP